MLACFVFGRGKDFRMTSTGYIDHSHTKQQTKIEISGLTCRTKCRKRIMVLRKVYGRAEGLGGKEGLVPQKCWQSGATPNDVIRGILQGSQTNRRSLRHVNQPSYPENRIPLEPVTEFKKRNDRIILSRKWLRNRRRLIWALDCVSRRTTSNRIPLDHQNMESFRKLNALSLWLQRFYPDV
jgi:hypothetical protein